MMGGMSGKKLTPERKKLRAELKARAVARKQRALQETAELPLCW